MKDRIPFEQAEIESSIVERWHRIVRLFPEETAVTTVDGPCYTYQEVDRKSNRLTHALLHELGAVNCPVVLLLDHAPTVLTAIMGALKANKAYVALDPTQQVGQLQLLGETAAAPVIVTDTKRYVLARAIASSAEAIWNIGELPAADEEHFDVCTGPDAVAGIFFTSGTTSQPRGVPRAHRMIMHRTWFNTATSAFGPGHRVSGMFQCGLGGGVADVFNALLNGAAYCFYPFHNVGLAGLSDWLQTQEITHFNLPVVLFRQWLDTLSPDDFFPHLAQVLPFGRKTRADIERLWPHVSDSCAMLTSYSATETTQVTCSEINRFTPLEEGTLHVGRPLPHKRVTIVKDDGRPAAAGEEGQIVVRSRYIASGYWRQPELSRQRFKLASDGSGETLYHTGDFGRVRPDGNLDLIGRRDSQVKVRGYRVVLSEVEDAIRALPSIREVFVLVDEARDRLLAYVVAADDPPPPSAIRSALSTHLPDYILPARYIYLNSLPLLASGKIDRQALPGLDRVRPELETPFVRPSTTLEQELAAMWATFLGIDQVGTQDDFFELGGDSLLTARLIVEVARRYGVELELKSFFREPTIAHLAETLESGGVTQEERSDQADGMLLVPGDPPNQPRGSTALNNFFDVLDMPPEFVPKSRPSEESNWNRRSRLLNLCAHSLPLQMSTTLASWLTGDAQLRTLFFKSKQRTIRQFLKCIDTSVEFESALASSLYFYLVHRYRLGLPDGQRHVLPQHVDRQTQMKGLEKLMKAKEQGQGVVLVRTHDYAATWYRPLKLADCRVGSGRHVVAKLWRRSVLDENALFVHQLNGARKSLLSGQVVEINGDGYQGTSAGIEHKFHGRRHRFLSGFAELALMSDAAVFVVECSLQRPLNACIELTGPLDSGSGTMAHEERIELLVSQYVQLLHKQWADAPWQVPLRQMDQHLNTPPAAGKPSEIEPI